MGARAGDVCTFVLALPPHCYQAWRCRSQGQAGGLCDKCFRGVGMEVRIGAACRSGLPQGRTVDVAPLDLLVFPRGRGRPGETQGAGMYFPTRRLKRPRGSQGERLRGGLPGVLSPFGLLKLTVSHCPRWRDRYESLVENFFLTPRNFFLTPYPACTA